MYGIVNKAVEGLIKEKHGESHWSKIKDKSDLSTTTFLSNEQYDDAITYSLLVNASEILEIDLKDILIDLGKYWIMKTGLEKYGSLMWSGGADFEKFMMNLPNFHTRIMLMYPEIIPPEFIVHKQAENTLRVEYYSEREGLTNFVYGLLLGLGEMYKINIEIEVFEKNENQNFDYFITKW